MTRKLPGHDVPHGVYPDMPIDHYHGAAAMSSSGLQHAARSMAHYLEHRANAADSKALAFGRVFHSQILDEPDQRIPFVVSTFDSMRTKAAKEWKAEQEAAGVVVFDKGEGDNLAGALDALRSHIWAQNILAAGQHEVSYFWDDRGVPCRARTDSYVADACAVVDIKTTRDASPDAFRRSCANLHYHRRLAFYQRGLAALGLRVDGHILICVEKDPPHGVAIYHLDSAWLRKGSMLVDRELARVRAWLTDPATPTGYPVEPQILEAPPWL